MRHRSLVPSDAASINGKFKGDSVLQVDQLLKLGNHFICEFSGCDQARLHDNDYVKSAFLHAAQENHLTIVAQSGYAFAPHGFTYYLLLAESHASIHVWPEYAYAAVDLFTCNLEIDAQQFVDTLKQAFDASEVTIKLHERGCPRTLIPQPAMSDEGHAS
jgi:S-adenosylmethionine decarboxylase